MQKRSISLHGDEVLLKFSRTYATYHFSGSVFATIVYSICFGLSLRATTHALLMIMGLVASKFGPLRCVLVTTVEAFLPILPWPEVWLVGEKLVRASSHPRPLL